MCIAGPGRENARARAALNAGVAIIKIHLHTTIHRVSLSPLLSPKSHNAPPEITNTLRSLTKNRIPLAAPDRGLSPCLSHL